MSSNNIIYNTYFIGFADLNFKSSVQVEHYQAKNEEDCLRQALEEHGVFVHSDIDTIEKLMSVAEHNNFLISYPRKVKVTII